MRVASLRTVVFNRHDQSDEGTYDVALDDNEYVQRFEVDFGRVTAFVIEDAGPESA